MVKMSSQLRYYYDYKEEILKKRNEDIAKNPDKWREKWKKYRNTKKARFGQYRNNAKVKKIDFKLTEKQFEQYWQKSCNYCGLEVETIGIDRVNNKLGYHIDNLVSCCKICNYMKRKMTIDEFIGHCERIVTHNKRKPLN